MSKINDVRYISLEAEAYHYSHMMVYARDLTYKIFTLAAFDFMINDPMCDEEIWTAVPITEEERREIEGE